MTNKKLKLRYQEYSYVLKCLTVENAIEQLDELASLFYR